MGRKPNKVNDANCSLDANVIGFSDTYSLNERFDIRKVSVMSYEDIANRFHFNKELIDSKDYQLDMLPVVGFHDGKGFTSHGDKVVPYGAVIPNSARWEMVDNKEYKVVDVAFWKERYNEQLKDLDDCNQSMEIVKISGVYSKELGVFEVDDYTYDALCVLHETTQPAFSGARIFSLSDIKDEFDIFKKEFSEMLNNKQQKEGDDVVEDEIKTEDVVVEEVATEEVVTPTEETVETVVVTDTEVECENTEEVNMATEEKVEEDDEELAKKRAKCEEEPKTDYEALYNEMKTSFDALTENYATLSTEVETLRQFKANVEEVEAKEKAEMEQKAKNDLIEKFALKLSKKEIAEVIDDVANFSVDEINTKLSVVLANKLLSSTEDFASNKIVNIDNVDKTYSREERLVAELKNKKK